MQAVTCFQCGRDTMIAPNGYICPHCGEDLQYFLLPETIAEYFLARANDSSERGELGVALAEAERGLTYADSSELHLLAAILAKQLGRPDRMRQHVAAIPVDDTLRGEAEWLLRSHQDRERALQEAVRHTPVPYAAPVAVDDAQARTLLEELLGGHASDPMQPKRTGGEAVASVAIVTVAITLVAASWWWVGPGTLGGERVVAEPTVAAQNDGVPGAPSEADGRVAEGAVMPDASAPAPAANLAPTPVLLPTPTPAVPANLVQVVDEAPEVAASSPNSAVLLETSPFDLRQYLRDKGFVELAELAIDARLQEDTLLLQGFVHLDAQRRQLIEVARGVPDVREVNSVNLLLRPLPTYVVQAGDTLWSIVFNIYGNVDRLDEFAAYNRDVLPSPDALAPGMVLKVLPVQ